MAKPCAKKGMEKKERERRERETYFDLTLFEDRVGEEDRVLHRCLTAELDVGVT